MRKRNPFFTLIIYIKSKNFKINPLVSLWVEIQTFCLYCHSYFIEVLIQKFLLTHNKNL